MKVRRKDKISEKYFEQINRLINDQSASGSTGPIGQGELDQLWEEICSALDIEETWIRISSGMDTTMPVDKGPGLFFRGCAAIVLILLILAPVRRETQADSPAGGSYTANTVETEDTWRHAAPGKEGMKVIRERPVSDVVNAIPLTEAGFSEQPVITVPEGVAPADVTAAKTVERSLILPAAAPETGQNHRIDFQKEYNRLDRSTAPAVLKTVSAQVPAGRFTGGMVTSFRNTWLLNQETFDGLKPESLITTEFVVFPDAGLVLNYSLSGRWELQTDAYLFSSAGQEYEDYIFGHYSKKKIVLRYSTISLSAKYILYNERFPASRTSVNLMAGSYVSFLHRAEKKINNTTSSIIDEYNKFDYGIRLGGEIEVQLTDQLSVAPGVSFSLGIPNIYKGTAVIPGMIRRTRNGNADLHLSFYYNFY